MRAERCPACGRLKKRSVQHNAYYWLLLNAISQNVRPDGQSYSPESWHEHMKREFLGRFEVRLPGGKTDWITHSSADLDPIPFGEYATKVEAWAAENGVYLQDLAA